MSKNKNNKPIWNTRINKNSNNLFKKIGVTFSVYNNYDVSERLIPFESFSQLRTHEKASHFYNYQLLLSFHDFSY